MKIIIDTNFIIDLLRFKIPIENLNYLIPNSKLTTINQVIKELKSIAGRRTQKDSKYAMVALKIIENFEIIETEKGLADDILVKISNKDNIIATNDSNLRRRLKRKELKSIYLRGCKKIFIE